jgi:hypothetical protein
VTDLTLEDVGTITATWKDPDGTVWPLSDTSPDVGWFTTQGPAGWNATSYEIVTDPLPRGGEQVRFIRAKPAVITWPIHVFGDTHQSYVDRHRQIRRAFTKTVHLGVPGVLTVARPDGSARTIEGFYQGGLEGEAGEGWLYSTDAISLFCPDGYWKDADPIIFINAYTTGASYLSPFPQVSASLAFGSQTVTSPGDVEAWPQWTITGPMTALTATNLRTGYEFTLTYGLLAGEQITISTDRPMLRGPAGQNLVSALDWPNAFLWSLLPGDNQVIFNLSGATAGTKVQLLFYPRYEGA